MNQNRHIYQNGVLIPIALTMHQPSLASQIANNPPIIEKTPITNISLDINISKLNKEIITIPAKIDRMPIVKRNNLPFESMLHCLCINLRKIIDILISV